MQPPGGVDTRRETRIICYLAAVSISYLSVFSFSFQLILLFSCFTFSFCCFKFFPSLKVILAILVLVAVIVVLTMMVAHHEMDFTNF